jgi:hypothetical protein
MGLFGRRRPRDSRIELKVGNAAYDEWPIVGDFEEISVAMAFCQQLRESGFAAELTSDWPLDEFGRADIALRVHPEEDQWAARDLVEFPEDDEDDLDD